VLINDLIVGQITSTLRQIISPTTASIEAHALSDYAPLACFGGPCAQSLTSGSHIAAAAGMSRGSRSLLKSPPTLSIQVMPILGSLRPASPLMWLEFLQSLVRYCEHRLLALVLGTDGPSPHPTSAVCCLPAACKAKSRLSAVPRRALVCIIWQASRFTQDAGNVRDGEAAPDRDPLGDVHARPVTCARFPGGRSVRACGAFTPVGRTAERSAPDSVLARGLRPTLKRRRRTAASELPGAVHRRGIKALRDSL
jgi:hypothetical protein